MVTSIYIRKYLFSFPDLDSNRKEYFWYIRSSSIDVPGSMCFRIPRPIHREISPRTSAVSETIVFGMK